MKNQLRGLGRSLPAALLLSWLFMQASAADLQIMFEPYIQYTTGGWNSTGIAAVDMDDDDDLDLLISNRVTCDVTTLENDGNGVFEFINSVNVGLTPRYVRAADLNGDGAPDCATPDFDGNSVSIALNDGDGRLILFQVIDLYRPAVLELADVDLDDDYDIIVPHWNEDAELPSQDLAMVTVLFNDGFGGFWPGEPAMIGIQPRGMDIADFNHDGFPDVIVCNLASSDMDLLINAGDGTFLPSIILPAPEQPRYVTAGDWDADGEIDLSVVSKSLDLIEFMHGEGDGNFTVTQTRPTGANPHSCTSSDLDGDGDLDVIASHVSSRLVAVYTNDGHGWFSSMIELYSPSGPAEVIAVDVDDDGLPDILTANSNNATTSVHINISGEVEPPVPCLADIDQNGVVDILDLLEVLNFWGPCEFGPCTSADLVRDEVIDILDMLAVLDEWGDCDD